MTTGMPRDRRCSTAGLSFTSEPVITRPLALKNLRQGGHGHAANPHQMCLFAGHDIIMDSINRHWVYTPFPFRYNIGWTR